MERDVEMETGGDSQQYLRLHLHHNTRDGWTCSCGGVAITAVAECLVAFSTVGLAGLSVPAYSLNVKSQSSQTLPRAYGPGFPTLMSAVPLSSQILSISVH